MRIIFIAIAGLCLGSCEPLTASLRPGESLTDAQVSQFIQAYRNVRAIAPNLAPPSLHDAPNLRGISPEKVDKAVKAAGLSGTAEFVLLSAKVGAAMSLIEARGFAGDLSERSQAAAEQVQQLLQNPHLPAEARVRLSAQLEKSRSEVVGGVAWVQRAMDWVRGLGADASQEVVQRHRDELKAAFSQR